MEIFRREKYLYNFFHKIIVPGILIWIPRKKLAGISADPWPGWSPYVRRTLTLHNGDLAAPLQCTQANHPVGYAKTQETSFTGEPKRSTPPKMVLGRHRPHPAHTSWLKKSFLLWNDSTSHHIVTEYDKELQHHLFNSSYSLTIMNSFLNFLYRKAKWSSIFFIWSLPICFYFLAFEVSYLEYCAFSRYY